MLSHLCSSLQLSRPEALSGMGPKKECSHNMSLVGRTPSAPKPVSSSSLKPAKAKLPETLAFTFHRHNLGYLAHLLASEFFCLLPVTVTNQT